MAKSDASKVKYEIKNGHLLGFTMFTKKFRTSVKNPYSPYWFYFLDTNRFLFKFIEVLHTVMA